MVPARAKLNLDLEVVGRRPDGYHDLRSTIQAIDLHDLLEIAAAAKTTFTSEGFAVPGSDNSVLKAHQAVELASKRELPVAIHLHKRIPPGSGMGGPSSDAAATLIALQSMFKPAVDLHRIAAELGSDVPFFLQGGRARVEGRGEKLACLGSPAHAWFAVAWPGYGIGTADVYKAWDGVRGEGPNELRRAAEHVEPRLEEFAARLGTGWQMTGSGSAFFKQTQTEREAKDAMTDLDCWTAVAAAMPPWA